MGGVDIILSSAYSPHTGTEKGPNSLFLQFGHKGNAVSTVYRVYCTAYIRYLHKPPSWSLPNCTASPSDVGIREMQKCSEGLAEINPT